VRPAAVVLAAGASRRMGSPKGLLRLDGHPLLRRHVDALRPVASHIVVIVGAEVDRQRGVLGGRATVVVSRHWREEHPSDSLRRAFEASGIHGWCWVTPVDVPPARPSTLRALLGARANVPTGPMGNGHPVLLSPALVRRVRHGEAADGLHHLLADAKTVVVTDRWVSNDFDTPAEWDAFVKGRARA
jgi:molybdenum cofactor cytidylyltransferase